MRVLALLLMALLCGAGGAKAAPTIADLCEANNAYLTIAKSDLGGAFGMHFVSFVKNNDGTPILFNGQIRAYYIKGNSSGQLCVGLATSPDGSTWTDQGLVLSTTPGAWDSTMASFPGVFYDNGTTYLVYEGTGGTNGDVGLARSSDGYNFTKHGRILYHNTTGWESVNIGTPSIMKVGGTWYVYYHGYDGVDCRIGVASGTNIFALAKQPNPIVDTSASGWDSGTAGKRDIIQEWNGNYYMVYEGSTDQPYGSAKWSTGFARSSSPLGPWTKISQNHALPQTNNTFGNDGPALLKFNGLTWVYYRVGSTWRALISDPATIALPQAWNAQSGALGHTTGRADGTGWSANTAQDAPGWLNFGPYNSGTYGAVNPWGNNVAVWQLSIDNNSADNLDQVRLEVVDYDAGGQVVASRIITRQQFKITNHAEWFYVPFNWDASRAGHRMELRCWWYDHAYVKLQTVGLSS